MKKLSEKEKRRLWYEKLNRRKKINVVAKEIDKVVYNFLMAMSRDWWNKVFISSDQVPPSMEAIEEILKRYERRFKRYDRDLNIVR